MIYSFKTHFISNETSTIQDDLLVRGLYPLSQKNDQIYPFL